MSPKLEITVSPHYEVRWGANDDKTEMNVLRSFFPTCAPDKMNFVLFSTNGIHGSPITIEDIERDLTLTDQEIGDPEERATDLTYLVVQPRLVVLVYGVCQPQNQADINWLKKLRAESTKVMATLSYPQ